MRTTTACTLLLALAGCWREGPGPAPPPLRPTPTTPEPEARKGGWRQSDPVAVAPEPEVPTRTPEQIAQGLAVELRSNGIMAMPSFVAGPAVVLDIDAGSLGVLCDAAAANAAQVWGQMFADPSRASPRCRRSPSDSYTCSQFGGQKILIVELADPDAWRIVSVIVGNMGSGRSTMSTKMSQMRSLINTATCP